jgi:hypothetical protein
MAFWMGNWEGQLREKQWKSKAGEGEEGKAHEHCPFCVGCQYHGKVWTAVELDW